MPIAARTNMARRCRCWLLIIGVLTLTSCERAHRYGAAPKKEEPAPEVKDELPKKGPYWQTWHAPGAVERDLPIQFVAQLTKDDLPNPEWASLKGFWNVFPNPQEMVAAPFGLDPIGAMAALVVIDHHATLKIKVPLGLPDPTPHIPKGNPPSFNKWRLGKALFHERLLPAGADLYSCATCHKPDTGFTDRERHPNDKRRTLRLINVVYNRRQFWDGRVETLEETLVRGLSENRAFSSEKTLEDHNWPGFVAALVTRKTYDRAFEEAFGVQHPTQDAVARALATYMRTILSGDSLYDRAEKIRREAKTPILREEHFLEPLKDESLVKELPEDDKKYTREKLATKLVEGDRIFRGRGRCATCHSGPLFTDQDYHNVGYANIKDAQPATGTETGRALHVPVGLKESRLIGAFRTPSLRNLAKTGPYFHDGSYYQLMEVVKFFDDGVIDFTTHLAAELKDGDVPRRLRLDADDREALVLFLRSLEGTPVDPMVAGK
jgi:cytochrome c peroxidase